MAGLSRQTEAVAGALGLSRSRAPDLLIEDGQVSFVAGSTRDDAWTGGGLQDGPVADARFMGPTGLALATDGSL